MIKRTKAPIKKWTLDRLILAGSSSVHTWRYLKAISPFVREIIFIGGDIPKGYPPSNLIGHLVVSFSLHAFFLPFKIRRWLTTTCPDFQKGSTLLHIHQANSVAFHMLAAMHNVDIPILLTGYGSDVLRNIKIGWQRLLLKQYLKRVDSMTVPSYEMARLLDQHYSVIPPLSVLNFGIKAPKVLPLKKEKIVLSTRLHKPLYRIDAILEAWQKVQAIDPDWSLVIAAEGESTKALKKQAQELALKRIKFTSMLEETSLGELYQRSAIVVSVPTSDAVSLSLFESMAYGCIPVVSNIAGNLEVITDGVNGVVHLDQIQSLSMSLMRAMKLSGDQRWVKQLVQHNQHIVAVRGLQKKATMAFVALYQKLLQKIPS